MIDTTSRENDDIPVVGKSYEDSYLRPADSKTSERSCVCADMCLCRFMARIRYGNDSRYIFTGVEFMLPKEREEWMENGTLPSVHGKCLVCLRYWTTYMYIGARSNALSGQNTSDAASSKQPNGRAANSMAMRFQMHHNMISDGCQINVKAKQAVGCVDGYMRSAMLFTEEDDTKCGEDTSTILGAVKWRPIVRFDSRHFVYVWDSLRKEPTIVQSGVAYDLNTVPSNDSPAASTADGSGVQQTV